jgi:hypothetical protein
VSALQTKADTLKLLQAESRQDLHPTLAALLPAILGKAFIRLHVILARQAGEL